MSRMSSMYATRYKDEDEYESLSKEEDESESSSEDDDELESSSEDEDESFIFLYHHTDKDSALRIIQKRKIKQSEGSGDAAFGYGVYLTEIGPSSSRYVVAKNNYDAKGGWKKKIKQGKTEVAIRIKIEKSRVKLCDTKRNIYLYPGDLNLKHVEDWKVTIRDDK